MDMDKTRQELINKTVETTMAMVERDRTSFEKIANNEMATWSEDDGFMVRGAILSILIIQRCNMIRYLGEESDPPEKLSPFRSAALEKMLSKSDMLLLAANKQYSEPLTESERRVLSSCAHAFMLLVRDGTIQA
jgi:hypothetical protein